MPRCHELGQDMRGICSLSGCASAEGTGPFQLSPHSSWQSRLPSHCAETWPVIWPGLHQPGLVSSCKTRKEGLASSTVSTKALLSSLSRLAKLSGDSIISVKVGPTPKPGFRPSPIPTPVLLRITIIGRGIDMPIGTPNGIRKKAPLPGGGCCCPWKLSLAGIGMPS
jgi:hypothetical protein